MSALLAVEHLTKTFPGVRALDDVSMSVAGGEILALVGHNGSGKSTLVKVLSGIYSPDHGRVLLPGGEQNRRNGLHVIHQDLGLVPMLSAVENIDLARRHGARALLPYPSRRERVGARTLIRRFGGTFDVTIPVLRLSPAERTLVAIARALDGWTTSRNVLVLDEPTAALAETEVRKLFEAIRSISATGAGVIVISHRLDEVVELADRVVVLRDGRVVADQVRGGFDQASLATLIAGVDEPPEVEVARRREGGEVVLSTEGLACEQITGLDLEVRAGEIVGITGLLGSGAERVCSAVFGAIPATGAVRVAGMPVRPGSPAAAIAAGIGYAPGDRRRLGAVVTMTARENFTLPWLRPLRGRWGQLRRGAERAEARTWMSSFGVRPHAATERPFGLFSGGNQQKILIAKWVRNRPRVLLLEEPTQGVDVAAQAGVHQLVASTAADGAAVLVCSSDAKELATLCHRVVVMHAGVVAATLRGTELTEQAIVRSVLTPGTDLARDHHQDGQP